MTVLATRSIEHRYDGETALAASDLDLGQDAHCALIGQSGCGKTTLLHVLPGLLPPTEGRVMLDDDDLHRLRRSDRWRGARFGVVPQKLRLISSLSALDNVRLAQTRSFAVTGWTGTPNLIGALALALGVATGTALIPAWRAANRDVHAVLAEG